MELKTLTWIFLAVITLDVGWCKELSQGNKWPCGPMCGPECDGGYPCPWEGPCGVGPGPWGCPGAPYWGHGGPCWGGLWGPGAPLACPSPWGPCPGGPWGVPPCPPTMAKSPCKSTSSRKTRQTKSHDAEAD